MNTVLCYGKYVTLAESTMILRHRFLCEVRECDDHID